MSIENNEFAPIKESAQEDKTADAFRADLFESTGRHHHHGGGYGWPYGGPIHIDRPTSRVNALQYEVHDGKITIKSR